MNERLGMLIKLMGGEPNGIDMPRLGVEWMDDLIDEAIEEAESQQDNQSHREINVHTSYGTSSHGACRDDLEMKDAH